MEWHSDACELQPRAPKVVDPRPSHGEKIAALAEAQVAAASAAIEGGSNRRVTRKVLGVYKRARSSQQTKTHKIASRKIPCSGTASHTSQEERKCLTSFTERAL